MKKVIIAGSRTFTDYELLKIKLDHILTEPVVILSGGANGADSLGERYAKEKGFPCEVFPAKWNDFSEPCVRKTGRYGDYNAIAGLKRNRQMLEAVLANPDGGMLIAFWNCTSSGTANMVKISREAGIEVKIVEVG